MNKTQKFITRLAEDTPLIMGVLNVTQDSFSDGGKFLDVEKAVEHGIKMIRNGAEVIDVGGESTRPGAEIMDPRVEQEYIVPVIQELSKHAELISVDTRNASTMEAALNAGANIVNDISSLNHDVKSINVVAEAKVPVILMHMQGVPQTMQDNPMYNNVIEDIVNFFESKIKHCKTHRIDEKCIVIDPGIGFGKKLEDNLIILRNIKDFCNLGCSILLGTSRKSFIGDICDKTSADERLPGSLSSVLWAHAQGVKFFRVHDVKETVQALKVYRRISAAG